MTRAERFGWSFVFDPAAAPGKGRGKADRSTGHMGFLVASDTR
ncbi:MAG TPA: hypothetical protein VES62_05880 [Thermoleophilaceae bacterium]|nr:hypothetical protein [Thermoleophilaceae bacterium]